MNNFELLITTIIQNSPSLIFTKSKLTKWLMDQGRCHSTARNIIHYYFKRLPIAQVTHKHFKLVVDPADFIPQTNPEPIKKETKVKDLTVHKQIVDYLNTKAGTKFKGGPSVYAKINARLSEGFTLDDFKQVIDKKCIEWTGTNFEQYLRPETLFSTKFESYLNQKFSGGMTKTESMMSYDFSKYIKGE